MKTRSYVSPALARAAQRRERVLAADLGLLVGEPERREVLPQHGRGGRLALDEHRPRGAPRERLDAERAGAGEQVEHVAPSTSPSIANSASRTRSEVGRVRRPARRLQAPAAEASRDHAHRANRSGPRP